MNMRSRIVAIPLVANYDIYAVDAYKRLSLDLPALEGLFPHAEAVWVEALFLNVADNEIKWGIEAMVGYDRDNELSAQDLFADQSTAGSVKVDGTMATSLYRQHTRLVLRWKLYTPGGAKLSGRLSATLYVKTAGM